MPIEVLKRIDDPRLVLGIAEVEGGEVREASAELKAIAAELAARIIETAWEIPEEQRRSVRNLLKLGGFSATGRNRPAHELLVNDLKERGEFHHINNVVDVNNVLSLETLLPISIFDLDKLTAPVSVRIGEVGEGYVFNASGQWLDVKRCIVCCHHPAGAPGAGDVGEPIGSPVKDSMATKLFPPASRILGVIYGPSETCSAAQMAAHAQRFAELLAQETGGRIVQSRVL